MTAMVAGISKAAVEREAAMMEASSNFIWARKLRALRAALDKAEAERDRLREALIELIQQTHNCERELTEDLHHVDFCGESLPLTNAREALKGKTNE